MAKTWVLDTETKGTGAHMVPLERATKRSSATEPVFVPRKDVPPREPKAPAPTPPKRFRIIDVMTRRTLLEDADARAAVDALASVRTALDANVYIWDEARSRWQMLPVSDQRALWELAHR